MSVLVTRKGRLRFLQQTAPRLMGEPDLEYVLVDWDCPEGSGEWLKSNYPQAKVVSSNEDRTRYYQEKDKRISQRVNAKRLAEEPIRMFHGCVLNAASGPIPEAPLPSGASTGNASELTADASLPLVDTRVAAISSLPERFEWQREAQLLGGHNDMALHTHLQHLFG